MLSDAASGYVRRGERYPCELTSPTTELPSSRVDVPTARGNS